MYLIPSELKYCLETGQIIPIENKVLHVPVSMTNEMVTIRDHLIKRINAIYNAKGKLSNNILINTVLTDAGIDLETLERKKRKQYVDGIIKMLEYWNNPELGDGAIKYGYKLNYGKKKALESITINPKPKK